MKIPKVSYYDATIAPAWLPIEDTAGQPLKPIIRCRCGALCNIRLHHVHADGRVTASFLHAAGGATPAQQQCGWHEFLELEGYDGPEFPPRP